MKRKEDAEERRKQEEQQQALAEQGHWRVAPIKTCSQPRYLDTSHLPSDARRFRVEYDTSLAGAVARPSSGSAWGGRQSYGKFNPEIEVETGSCCRHVDGMLEDG